MCFHSEEQAYVNTFTVSIGKTAQHASQRLTIPRFQLRYKALRLSPI